MLRPPVCNELTSAYRSQASMLEPIHKATHCAFGYAQSFGSLPEMALRTHQRLWPNHAPLGERQASR